jgi:dTMP kinase
MNKLQIYNLFKTQNKKSGGKLITIEGIDGCGKRTQTEMLTKYLVEKGYNVKKFSFPNYDGLIGETIASYLRGDYGDVDSMPQKVLSIAYAADRLKIKDEINQHLLKGFIVLCDRYTYSNAFQAAKMKKKERMNFIEWVENLEFKEMKIPKPDFNVYLHIDQEISSERTKKRGKREYQKCQEDIHENNEDLLKNTSSVYMSLCENRKNWLLINQMKNGKQINKEDVFDLLRNKIDDFL